jgi:hypothetical protein
VFFQAAAAAAAACALQYRGRCATDPAPASASACRAGLYAAQLRGCYVLRAATDDGHVVACYCSSVMRLAWCARCRTLGVEV